MNEKEINTLVDYLWSRYVTVYHLDYDRIEKDYQLFKKYMEENGEKIYDLDVNKFRKKAKDGRVFSIEGFLAGFYTEDAVRKVLRFIVEKKINAWGKRGGMLKRAKLRIWKFIEREKIETFSWFEGVDLVTHNEGRWIRNMETQD